MLLSIIFGASFGNLMRLAQARRRNIWWVGATNYAMAAGLALAWWAVTSRAPLLSALAVLGVCAGLALAGAYFLMNAALICAGVGVTTAVDRLSIVIPVTAAVLVWHEKLSAMRAAGLPLAVFSLLMLARSNAIPTQAKSRSKLLVLAGLFVVAAITRLCMKAMTRGCPQGGELVFLMFMFATAALIVFAYALRKPRRPALGEIVHGMVLGSANMLALFSMASALLALDAVVVFPTVSVGVILVGACSGMTLWGEKFRREALVGLAIGAVALILVNM